MLNFKYYVRAHLRKKGYLNEAEETETELPSLDDANADDGGLGDGTEGAPAPPPVDPGVPPSQRELEAIDIAIQALSFDPDYIPAKALVVYDMPEYEKVSELVKRIIKYQPNYIATSGNDTDPFADPNDPADLPQEQDTPPEDEDSKKRFKQIKTSLATLIKRCLKMDPSQITVDMDVFSEPISPDTVDLIRQELTVMAGT